MADRKHHSLEVVNRIIHAVLLQVDFLSDYGLDVCVALAAPKRVQLWTSRTWSGNLKDIVREAANLQAGLDKENVNLDMFVEMNSESSSTNHRINQDDQTATNNESLYQPVIDRRTEAENDAVSNRSIQADEGDGVWVKQEVEQNSCVNAGERYPEQWLDMQLGVKTGSGPGKEGTRTQPEAQQIVQTSGHVEEFYPQSYLVLNTETLASPRQTIMGDKPKRKEYKCSQCDFTTFYRSNLNTHSITHTGQLPSQFELYNYSSNNRGNMKNRMKFHTKEKPYKCKLCSYGCNNAANLSWHMNCAHVENLNCPMCVFSTTQRDSLMAHLKTHTDHGLSNRTQFDYQMAHHSSSHQPNAMSHTVGLFECNLCDYKTTRSTNLKLHMKKHTGDMLSCDLCDYKTVYRGALRNHKISMHLSRPRLDLKPIAPQPSTAILHGTELY